MSRRLLAFLLSISCLSGLGAATAVAVQAASPAAVAAGPTLPIPYELPGCC